MANRSNEPAAMDLDDHGLSSPSPSAEFAAAASGGGMQNLLPIAVYGRIGKYVDVGNSDLTSLCIAVGKEISDEIRRAYLVENEEYLRHTITSGPATLRKAKLLNWMEVNSDWRKRCTESKNADRPDVTRTTVEHSQLAGFQFQKTSFGSFSFQSYTGVGVLDDPPSQGDLLLSVGDTDVAGISVKVLHEFFGLLQRDPPHDRPPLRLVFVNNADFIFNRPSWAIFTGLAPILQEMVDNGSVDVNSMYEGALVPQGNESLLHYSVSDSPDDSCFKYLVALEDIDTSVRGGHSEGSFTVTVLHSCAVSSKHFSPSALETLLKHPGAPNVNDVDVHNWTALHCLCMGQSQPYNIRIPKLKLLLDNGADPLITNVSGAMPIDILYGYASSRQQNEPEFEEMAGLLLQGKRDV